MMSNSSTYLKFANLQIAAEAIYPDDFTKGQIPQSVLIAGNNRSSKFTPTQAAEFAADWEVIEHKSNTTTGFSGTLFKARRSDPERGIVAGELVLSFRSTEFADDATRDNQATNVMEIKEKGWAFGQIDDMRKWVDALTASGKLPGVSNVTVTGYSLGGHLATAFNLLYPHSGATYTFNGAGVGETAAGYSLTQVADDFASHRGLGVNTDRKAARDSRPRKLFRQSHRTVTPTTKRTEATCCR